MGGEVKKAIVIIVISAVIRFSCSFMDNPLIGEWIVYKVQGPDGIITDIPSDYDARFIYSKKSYI